MRWRARVLATGVAVVALAFTARPAPMAPAQSSSGPTPPVGNTFWPAGGRFVDAGFDTSDLANDIYVNGLPPELRPQIFLFQRLESGGFQAELDFPAPVVQLHHYLAGDSNDAGDAFPDQAIPVRHTVDLILQPPSGDPTTVSVQADGTTVVTKAGAQVDTTRSLFAGNRLAIVVPASVPVQHDWTVQAVIRIAGDQPLRPAGGERGLPAMLSFATNPALVGVLTGDDATGPEPLATRTLVNRQQLGVQDPDTVEIPSGGRPQSVHLESGGNGIVAVVTLDSPPAPPPSDLSVDGQKITQEQLRLSLAPDVQDGLGPPRIEVDFFYPNNECPQPPCPTGATASVLVAGNDVGSVPVTVSGNDVRFDFGGFQTLQSQSQSPSSVPDESTLIGAFSDTWTLSNQDLDMVPIGDAPPAQGTTTIKIDKTNISITSPAGETATGLVNPLDGYFYATDADEIWTGFLGRQGWYEKVVQGKPAAALVGASPAYDLGQSPVSDIIAYYWNQKVTKGVQSLPPALIQTLKQFRPPGGFESNSVGLNQFVDAVEEWLDKSGLNHVLAFPPGDPVVVPAPDPVPFPLASAFPSLAPDGGQWELAAGVKLSGDHGFPVFMLGPYVPASSLLVAGVATPSGTARSSASHGGGSSGGGIAAVVVVVAVIAGGGALVWTRRRRKDHAAADI